ncbi:uncharacterized protein BP01DRAFT_363170 [Aspergillus saccharolyticus JOP 1030-1]|uniref:Uncharacterized protein n=1 Tax=Aspergillus saccharolyticus JOP 1030-1 TaxID=1450539 RepID=A0A319A898_9EURO|nr:hypothetical protein BP01DRAFT_363170 [Aspergillus saccharolyticus JOP 1030-1]PYH47978.1 hypothetical protein BP01DRAFT_363170 [Aspergillus saccharolyticus JOP 1030-1]
MARKKRKSAELPAPGSARQPHQNANGPGTFTAEPTQDRSKRREHDTFQVFQKSQLAWARFWAEKAAKLASPFATIDAKDETVQVKVDETKKVSGQQIPRYDGSDFNPPLSRRAVAEIVMQTRADCPKAKAWLSANARGSETRGKEEQNVGIVEREYRRKRTVENLRYRTMIALKASEASKEEVREVMDILPPVQLKTTPAVTTEAEMVAQVKRVEKAHERLQETLAAMEDLKCS